MNLYRSQDPRGQSFSLYSYVIDLCEIGESWRVKETHINIDKSDQME